MSEARYPVKGRRVGTRWRRKKHAGEQTPENVFHDVHRPPEPSALNSMTFAKVES